MKKVGIMSMQRVYNYGSFLQAYALKQLIEQLGCEVEFVDYHIGDCLVKEKKKKKLLCKSRVVSKIIDYLAIDAPLNVKILFILHKKNFGKKYYPLLGISESRNYQPYLDVLVIGSDEVFNCVQKNSNVGFSKELFGKENNAKKLISYAASSGNTTIGKLKKYNIDKEVGEYFKKFNAISVRDRNTGEIIERTSGELPLYHLDPVLTYDYMGLCKDIPNHVPYKKYMVIYGYSGRFPKEQCDIIKNYADSKQLKIVCIGGVQACCDKFINCSPFEVIAYFNYADCVITDTFHGTIISIITHRRFVSIVRKSINDEYGNEEKIVDLLERMHLKNRLIIDMNEMENILSTNIDFDETDIIIAQERKRTVEYLQKEIFNN